MTWSALLLAVSAPFVGSFLGLVADRLPEGRSIVWPRSACDHCRTPLAVRDLIPVVSWLANRGRCRSCGGRIAIVNPLVELAALGVALWSVVVMPAWLAWPTAILGWALLTLAVIDFLHLMLLDEITLPLIPAGLAVAWWTGAAPLWTHAAAAVLAFLIVFGLRWVYWRLRGREGIGVGDAKLLAAAGAWVGLSGLPGILLLSGIFGLAYYWVRARVAGARTPDPEIALGPWIAVAFWLTWLYGPVQLV